MLDGIPPERVAAETPDLAVELRLSIGLHDLWALRPALFEQVARHFNQAEAARRLAELDRRYPPPRPPSASPRSARGRTHRLRSDAGPVAGITATTLR